MSSCVHGYFQAHLWDRRQVGDFKYSKCDICGKEVKGWENEKASKDHKPGNEAVVQPEGNALQLDLFPSTPHLEENTKQDSCGDQETTKETRG